MPVFRTLEQLAKRWGLSASSATDQQVMLRFYNQALKELNESSDLFGSLAEIAIPVVQPSLITLPQEVATLRAVRWASSKIPYEILPVSAKYSWTAWGNAWRSFIPIGYRPLARSFSVTGPVMLRTVVADSAEIVIVGSTTASSMQEETVVMDATTKTTTAAFATINAISRKVLGTYDVKITDSKENDLARLRNNSYTTKYYTAEISEFPGVAEASDECQRLVDCLVKLEIPEIVSLYQEPPISGYDDLLIDYCSYLWSKEKEQGEAAIAFKSVVDERMMQIARHQTGAEQSSVQFAPHRHDQILAPYGNFITSGFFRRF